MNKYRIVMGYAILLGFWSLIGAMGGPTPLSGSDLEPQDPTEVSRCEVENGSVGAGCAIDTAGSFVSKGLSLESPYAAVTLVLLTPLAVGLVLVLVSILPGFG